MSKLNPEDLAVSSFSTAEPEALIAPTTWNDPTAATRCFICPPITYDCY